MSAIFTSLFEKWKEANFSITQALLNEFLHELGKLNKPHDAPPVTPHVDGRPPWLDKAVSYIGTHEGDHKGSDDNPVILNWGKEVGGEAGAAYTHDAIPWCKLFVIAVLKESNLKYDDSLWALDSLKWGKDVGGPAVGALAVMQRSGGGHVTWVVGRDQNDNLMCCGGNQSDAVNIKPFDPDRVVGYRWPSEAPLPADDDIGVEALPLVQSDGELSAGES